MSDPFETPGHADKIEWSDVNGNLLLFTVHSIERQITTVHGISDAVKCQVVILDGDTAGNVLNDILVFPRVLQSQLSGRIGKMVLGRLGQGTKTPGKDAPWQLADPTDKDREVGKAWLAKQTEISEPF